MSGQKGMKKGIMKGEEFLAYQSVKTWFQSLEESAVQRGKSLTKNARAARLRSLMDYVNFSNSNPDALLEKGKKDLKDTMNNLTSFFSWLQGKTLENVEPRKVKIGWNAAITEQAYIRGFYTHNDLSFPKRFKIPRRKVSAVSKRDTKTAIYDYDEEKDEIIFRNGNLQHFLGNLSFRDQTIALGLLSTGADASDLLALNVGFVKDDRGKISLAKRFLWHGNRLKDGIEFKVFLSTEATQFLRRYVEQERAGAADDEPLFIKENGQRLPSHALAMNFRLASAKMGLKLDKNQAQPFRPKRLRHLFRTACANGGVDPGFTLAFMGHSSTISASYLEKSNGLFLKEYVKVEPYVTVFGVNEESITELSDQMQSLAKEMEEKDKQIKKLEGVVDEFKGMIASCLHDIDLLKKTRKKRVHVRS